jgi:hypothetical protein
MLRGNIHSAERRTNLLAFDDAGPLKFSSAELTIVTDYP